MELREQMGQMSGVVPLRSDGRRWPRHPVDLPVCIIALNGTLTTPVPARGREISRGGMALRVALAVDPGDLIQLQFPTTGRSRVTAVVRNRTGDCVGLEFVTQLPPDDVAMEAKLTPTPIGRNSQELQKRRREPCNPQSLFAGLRRKQLEIKQVQQQIDALKLAIRLLADEEKKSSGALLTSKSTLEMRAWPQQS